MTTNGSQSPPQEGPVQSKPDFVQVSIPHSFLQVKHWGWILSAFLGTSTLAGAGSGYLSGSLNSGQRLEVVTTVQEMGDEIREDIANVSRDLKAVSGKVSDVESEVSYIRGKMGLDERNYSAEEEAE